MSILVQPLSPQLLPQWLDFFDHHAFADNPAWAECYCCCYQLSCTDKEWEQKTKEQNRSSAQEMIKDGLMKGYLAFENSVPVGWCNVNDTSVFHRIISSEDYAALMRQGKTASVICFIVSARHRGKGIARQLLRQAIADCKVQGYDSIEAYPRMGTGLSHAAQFHGPLSLYLSEGFAVKKQFERYAVVSRKLQ